MRAYVNGKIFTGAKVLHGYGVLAQAGKVLDVVPVAAIPKSAEAIDLQNGLLAPGFMDLQIYGGNGAFFGEFPSVEALKATLAYCRAGGATSFLPTVATNSGSVMFAAVDAVREYWRQGGRGVLGLHLEGPYINPEKRGAHLKQFIQTPDIQGLKNLLDYGRGVVKMMTIAPEIFPEAVLDDLLQQDIICSAGHTNATYAQARDAFQKGIRTATHLFNAMSPLQHREPGMVGAILDTSGVAVSMVADGHHVDYAAIRIAKKVLKERMFLITDAVTTNRDGQYSHRLQGDKYVVADGTLSGSALTMVKAVRNVVQHCGIPLNEALRMAALYPARVMSLDDSRGNIGPGFAENFVLLDKSLNVLSVIDHTEG